MVISEVRTYGGHLSKRTVVPAVYILEKVTTWVTEQRQGPTLNARFGRRRF